LTIGEPQVSIIDEFGNLQSWAFRTWALHWSAKEDSYEYSPLSVEAFAVNYNLVLYM
jgi:hypothetical protein